MLKKVFLAIFSFGLLFCSQKQADVNETILVRVADKTISVNEFIRRSEYTIRPPWCRNDNYIHRKIALNSLIAEKLLALEADKELLDNEEIQLYLQGRKEQAMRKIHFYQEAASKVNNDPKTLSVIRRNAERTYKLQVIPIPDDSIAAEIETQLNRGQLTFDELYNLHIPDSLRAKEQEFGFSTPLPDQVTKALFFQKVEDEQVIGPLKLDHNNHVLFKVKNWTRKITMGENAINQLEKDILDKWNEIKSRDIYEDWLMDLMAGKELNFNRDTFKKLVNIIGPNYFKTAEQKESEINKRLWNKDEKETVILDNSAELEKMNNEVLLTFDDETWTVNDFKKELQLRPLVFRNKRMKKSKFSEQFRLAVADMIRDKFITKQAYKKGLDKHPLVKRDYEMWKDNLLALYHKNTMLKDVAIDSLTIIKIVNDYFDPYVEQLRHTYNDKIYINTDAFEKVELSSIDMFVIQKNAPFPIIVPDFPQLTTHNMLDYGKKLALGNSDDRKN